MSSINKDKLYQNIVKISIVLLTVIIISILLIKRFLYFRPSSEFLHYNVEKYKDVSNGNIHGWFIQGKTNKVILFCHGNAGNISHRQPHIDSLNDMGYSVMIFDYSGYGRSQGIPSETQIYHDASVYLDLLLQKKFDKKDIILYGESIGAPVAAHVALKFDIPTLIIDSGLPSIKKLIQGRWKALAIFGFLFPEFNTEVYMMRYRGRSLVMHSIHDEIIPYDTTDLLRHKATETINLQGTHNTKIIPWEQVDKFIQN